MTTPLLQLNQVTHTYDANSESRRETPVLDNASLTINEQDALAIVGPSGCGKSTLLNIIGALLQPTKGEALFEGRNIYELKERELAKFRNESLGFIFQSHHLLPQCTALENVLVPTLAVKGRDTSALAKRAKELLDQVGLADRADHTPARLSGGERQRVAVARALINQPKLLLADEPTGALDEDNADKLAAILNNINKDQGVTLVIVTHAESLAHQQQRLIQLSRGQLSESTLSNNHA